MDLSPWREICLATLGPSRALGEDTGAFSVETDVGDRLERIGDESRLVEGMRFTVSHLDLT